jgi:hypothetical protein
VADWDEINGVDSDAVVKIKGVAKANIEKVLDATTPASAANRWIVAGNAGKVFHTVQSDASSGWEELIDLGNNNHSNLAYGKDNSGVPRLILHAKNNTNEIMYINDDGNVDLTDSNNWTAVNHSTNYKAADTGPAIAWGNNVWIHGGVTMASTRTVDGASVTVYDGPNKSTDGGANWTKIDVDNTVNSVIDTMCYKSGSTWLMAIKDAVWKSTNDGDGWTSLGVVESGKRIRSMAYNGDGRWCAVLDSDNIWYSDDDGDNWTEASGAWSGTWHPNGIVWVAGSINKWVVCGNNGRLAYSADLTGSWTAIWDGDDASWGTDHIKGIATDNTTVVIVGSAGKLASSSNATSFTVRSITGNPTTTLNKVACDVIGAGMR